ncbi:hypothetical protein TRFO_19925 [Tritrichomonas foetus]|uniref:Uncharacterized protein n=1 Tax=Tritrichomonas foetus TaxID=1144522 RepID=A0A1J4KHM5_9EUKA|nr:hypothetical protein TRFO_19925 [Tritrichomonas foetus]|eukprot:OHT10707.1 hypothetical protein TRFO_19925 [Tritrichomonas foetus]
MTKKRKNIKEEKEHQGRERTSRKRKNIKEEKEHQGRERTSRKRKNIKEEREHQRRERTSKKIFAFYFVPSCESSRKCLKQEN